MNCFKYTFCNSTLSSQTQRIANSIASAAFLYASKCYESLIRQTSKDFEWLVIDDGSTDKTKELVESWRKEKKISIRYIYKKNGGMHTGYNTAYVVVFKK